MSGFPDRAGCRSGRRPAFAGIPLLFVLFLASLPFPARGQDFTIDSFHTDIEVQGDASLRVTETIDTVFHRPRHGLFRDIPFRYVDELGKTTVMPLRVVSVSDPSGKAWKYRVERRGGTLRIRIGDPDVTVENRQVYILTYTVGNALLFFPDHDELYWNVTGNDWPAAIRSASARVTIPAAGRAPAFRTRCFTGPRGSREEGCDAVSTPDGATFLANREFRPGEGMTVVLGWDKGIVRPPSRSTRTASFLYLREYWPLLAPPLTLLFLLVLWYRKGKDPATGDPLVVQYAPPDEGGRPLLPAELGTLLDERLDPRDITASIVDLAVRRRLAIEERKIPGLLFDKKEYVLKKEKDPGGELPLFERLLLEKLFPGGKTEVLVSDLKNEFYKNMKELGDTAFGELTRMGYFAAPPQSVKNRYILAGIGIAVAGAGAAKLGDLFSGSSFSWAMLAVGIALSGVLVALFSSVMPVKTLKGAKTVGRIRGFEEFLRRAEKDRLERMSDSHLFEKYLPYALALDVSERWAKAFEGVAQEPPGWYVSGDGSGSFRPSAFHHSLGSALTTMSGAMYAAPRSSGSGFSGGGSSGGGGGGGGGGSW